jgi:hypothetical protein
MSRHFWRNNLAPALEAVRLYWPAFLALQLAAAATVVGYYALVPVRDVAHWLLEWKIAWGLPFVAAASVFSGAILPETLKAILRPPGYRPPDAAAWLHLGSLMALLGVMVDGFYQLQGQWFGDDGGIATVILKIFVDQFVYALFLVMPLVIVWFAWKENGYSMRRTAAAMGWRSLLAKIPILFVPNLCFWVPSLAALYALPTDLQFLLFVFVNGAWCLVMIFVAREISRPAS